MAVRHHIKILVVDDDKHLSEMVAAWLEGHGFKPIIFQDPESAIEAAKKESYQIALIDVRMPKVTGAEVVGQLREIEPHMSCIIMTGYPDLETAKETMRRGARDYIEKPIDQEVLLDAVDRVCREMGLIYTNEGDLNKLIGQRIRTQRLNQSLTLRQLSDRTDLTTSQLSQVELGKNAASVWALARISNSLGMQLSDLLRGL